MLDKIFKGKKDSKTVAKKVCYLPSCYAMVGCLVGRGKEYLIQNFSIIIGSPNTVKFNVLSSSVLSW